LEGFCSTIELHPRAISVRFRLTLANPPLTLLEGQALALLNATASAALRFVRLPAQLDVLVEEAGFEPA
jgi:hypothetical protein